LRALFGLVIGIGAANLLERHDHGGLAPGAAIAQISCGFWQQVEFHCID
jgi:hypothetical protein